MFMYRAEENPAFQTCLKLVQEGRKGVQKLLLNFFYQFLSLVFNWIRLIIFLHNFRAQQLLHTFILLDFNDT